MKWFRSHIKQGSLTALLALAIQFALSFGHFHGVAAQAAPAFQSGLELDLSQADVLGAPNVIVDPDQQQSPPAHDTDPQNEPPQNGACAICAVISLAGSLLFATPPLLLLPQSIELLHLIADAEFVHLNNVRADFQPRAPPLS
ncbi:MAG TPA: DUF2946 family protein [Burkholderiaceae bacterium]|nr:DUF2946 family protein [Burkholderiaceae bacterium]